MSTVLLHREFFSPNEREGERRYEAAIRAIPMASGKIFSPTLFDFRFASRQFCCNILPFCSISSKVCSFISVAGWILSWSVDKLLGQAILDTFFYLFCMPLLINLRFKKVSLGIGGGLMLVAHQFLLIIWQSFKVDCKFGWNSQGFVPQLCINWTN